VLTRLIDKCGPLFLEEGDSYYLDLTVLCHGSPFTKKVGQVPMAKEQFESFWVSARNLVDRFGFQVAEEVDNLSDKNTKSESGGSSTSLEKANSQKTKEGPGSASVSKLSSKGEPKPERPTKFSWVRGSSKVLPLVSPKGILSISVYLLSKKAVQMTAYLVQYLKLLRLIFGSHVEDKLDALKSLGLTRDFLLLAVDMPLPIPLRKQLYKMLLEGLFINAPTLLDPPVLHLE